MSGLVISNSDRQASPQWKWEGETCHKLKALNIGCYRDETEKNIDEGRHRCCRVQELLICCSFLYFIQLMPEVYSEFDHISSVRICYVIPSKVTLIMHAEKICFPVEKVAGTARVVLQLSVFLSYVKRYSFSFLCRKTRFPSSLVIRCL